MSDFLSSGPMWGGVASVERLNGATWEEAGSMKVGRRGHTAVNIPAGVVTCRADQ